MDHLRTLLLQIRDEQRVREEEYASFVKFTGLSAAQIEIFNVFDQPIFEPTIIDGYDAVFVGGASEASVLEPDKYPFVKCGEDLMLYCIEQGIPTFASCYGFQLAVIALGGEIIRDTVNYEMGSIPIQLTDAAQDDLLYNDVSNPFMGISVHQEKALTLPDSCELLAYTEMCTHSFRVKEKPFWAFQFHPEVDKAVIDERLTIYKEHYTDNDEHLAEILASVVETPESNALLKKFVERVLSTRHSLS